LDLNTQPDTSAQWVRSRFCESGACVEVAVSGETIMVRDSKNVDQPVLRFTRAEWTAFLDGVAAGDFRSI